MLLTEEQAREKWCPQGRKGWIDELTMGVAGYSSNDPTDPPGNSCRCIASRCMMWRSVMKLVCRRKECKSERYVSFNDNDEHVCKCESVMDEARDRGYCGLAGKP